MESRRERETEKRRLNKKEKGTERGWEYKEQKGMKMKEIERV